MRQRIVLLWPKLYNYTVSQKQHILLLQYFLTWETEILRENIQSNHQIILHPADNAPIIFLNLSMDFSYPNIGVAPNLWLYKLSTAMVNIIAKYFHLGNMNIALMFSIGPSYSARVLCVESIVSLHSFDLFVQHSIAKQLCCHEQAFPYHGIATLLAQICN